MSSKVAHLRLNYKKPGIDIAKLVLRLSVDDIAKLGVEWRIDLVGNNQNMRIQLIDWISAVRSERKKLSIRESKIPDKVNKVVMKSWIHTDGTFLFGKYRGQEVSDIAQSNIRYLKWIQEEVKNCTEEDMIVFEYFIERA